MDQKIVSLQELLEYLKGHEKRLVCFGTGLMAKEALQYEEIRDSTNFFMDNDRMKQGKRFLCADRTYPVFAPDGLAGKLDEEWMILLVSGHGWEMEEQLAQMGLPPQVPVLSYSVLKARDSIRSREAFFQSRILTECMKEYEEVLDQYGVQGGERAAAKERKRAYILGKGEGKRPLVLPRIMIMPTTRCNLRCTGCSSLLPLFDHPSDVPLEQILHDFERFLKGIDQCIRITVGGEPFLYPSVKELLRYLLKQEKFLGIMMITNSTILPDEELVDLLRHPKVAVEISDYGNLERMSRLVALLERGGVRFKVLTDQVWTDMGGVQKRGRTREELQFSYLNCEQSRLMKGIHVGRFHTCARSARMLALGAYTSEHDYFTLSDEDTPEQLRGKIEAMMQSDYADACDYCDLGTLPARVIEAGIQMNGDRQKSAYTIVRRDEYERLKKQAVVKDQYEPDKSVR